MQSKTSTSGSAFTIAWPTTTIPTFFVTNPQNSLLPQWNQKPMQNKPIESVNSSIRTSRACLMLLATLLLLLLIAMGACLANILWLMSSSNTPDQQYGLPNELSNSIDLPSTNKPPFYRITSSSSSSSPLPSSSPPTFTENDLIIENNDDDGFGESLPSNNNNSSAGTSSEEEAFSDFFNRFNSTLDDLGRPSMRSSTPDPLDGEFVDHRTMTSDELDEMSVNPFDRVPADSSDASGEFGSELVLTDNSSSSSSSNESSDLSSTSTSTSTTTEPSSRSTGTSNDETSASSHSTFKLNEAKHLFASIPLQRFCSTSGSSCSQLENCRSKFIVLVTIQSSFTNHSSARLVNEQIYTVNVQQTVRRSPLLSVALRRSQLHVQLNSSESSVNDVHLTSNQCGTSQSDLKLGHTYLISGRVSGLHAISSNCDLRIDWNDDLNELQRDQLLLLLSSSSSSSLTATSGSQNSNTPLDYC